MATRQYATSFIGAYQTFTRSYQSATAHTPQVSFSRAYEGTFGGYTGSYLKDTSVIDHSFVKAYTTEVPYVKIYTKIWSGPTTANFTKHWIGDTGFTDVAEYLAQFETVYEKEYSKDYTKIWTKLWSKIMLRLMLKFG